MEIIARTNFKEILKTKLLKIGKWQIVYRHAFLKQCRLSYNVHPSDHAWLCLPRRVINDTLRAGNPVYVLDIDMRKAFNNVRQAAIVSKLSGANASQRARNCMKFFLENRHIPPSGLQPRWRPNLFPG